MADGALGQERGVGPFEHVLGMGARTRIVGLFFMAFCLR